MVSAESADTVGPDTIHPGIQRHQFIGYDALKCICISQWTGMYEHFVVRNRWSFERARKYAQYRTKSLFQLDKFVFRFVYLTLSHNCRLRMLPCCGWLGFKLSVTSNRVLCSIAKGGFYCARV